MKQFNILPINSSILSDLQNKINNKTKPLGALGRLEELAVHIGTIQNTLSPSITNPTIVVFAADHGIAEDNIVNLYPQDVTWQMVYNFVNGGAAINVFSTQNNISIKIVDAGVKHDFPADMNIERFKIGYGTKNYLYEPAMTLNECKSAINRGSDYVKTLKQQGVNTIGFGEMGIGNTSSASLLLHALSNQPLQDCVGRGTGLDDNGLLKKTAILANVCEKHGIQHSPLELLSIYGGFEIAMMCGAMMQAAEDKMILIIDGFIVTSALLVAHALYPAITDYCIYSHTSNETGHATMLRTLHAKPLLDLGMRLGEGTGAAVALPLIQASVNFLNKMASFESAGVSSN